MNVVGRGATHDRMHVLLNGLDIDDALYDEVFICLLNFFLNFTHQSDFLINLMDVF